MKEKGIEETPGKLAEYILHKVKDIAEKKAYLDAVAEAQRLSIEDEEKALEKERMERRERADQAKRKLPLSSTDSQDDVFLQPGPVMRNKKRVNMKKKQRK